MYKKNENDSGNQVLSTDIGAVVSNQPIYHYTILSRFLGIWRDGKINPTTKGIRRREIPAVWLSVAPAWEYTANKLVYKNKRKRPLTLSELLDRDILVRIQIDPLKVKIIEFEDLESALNIRGGDFTVDNLIAKMKGGNFQDTRAVAGCITEEAFLKVEICSTESLNWSEMKLP
jgi:hypothetical protein